MKCEAKGCYTIGTPTGDLLNFIGGNKYDEGVVFCFDHNKIWNDIKFEHLGGVEIEKSEGNK